MPPQWLLPVHALFVFCKSSWRMCAVVRHVVCALLHANVRFFDACRARCSMRMCADCQLVFKFSLPSFREFRQGGLHHEQICSDWTAYHIILVSFEGKSKRLQLRLPVICLNLLPWKIYTGMSAYLNILDPILMNLYIAPVREHWSHIMHSCQPCLDGAGEGLNGLTISSPNGTGYSVC